MIFATDDLRCHVVRETLLLLGECSPAAENLLLGTAAQESGMGSNMKAGRRLGLYHITPAAHRSVWDKYLIHSPDMASKVRGIASQKGFLQNPHGELMTNLKYATAIAWMVYKRAGKPLPEADDINGLATFWHRHFHPRPLADINVFINNYHKWITREEALVA